jgi:hypothetical protein
VASRWETIESMLQSSQRTRDALAGAVTKLDSYIDLLRQELADGGLGANAEGEGDADEAC